MGQGDGQSTVRDNLLTLPRWAAFTSVALLGLGALVGVTLLFAPDVSATLRASGGQLLVISLPGLALAIGLLGASWSRTERIDFMVHKFLRETVGNKIEAYLVKSTITDVGLDLHPPLFQRMDRVSHREITSFCSFYLYDRMERRFDIQVKSNVFNFELTLCLNLAARPTGLLAEHLDMSYEPDDRSEWGRATANPLVDLVAGTIHGSLSEGYTVYVAARPEPDGSLHVEYRFRQKPQTNFLTSPYQRRYFSEDAAIACYFFFAEAFASGVDISDGVLVSPQASAPTAAQARPTGERTVAG